MKIILNILCFLLYVKDFVLKIEIKKERSTKV
jgi:hypothetical protein